VLQRRRPIRQLSACSGGHVNLRPGRLPTKERCIKARTARTKVIRAPDMKIVSPTITGGGRGVVGRTRRAGRVKGLQ
jgi:hypothetical protein